MPGPSPGLHPSTRLRWDSRQCRRAERERGAHSEREEGEMRRGEEERERERGSFIKIQAHH